MVTEEAFRSADLRGISAWIAAQPSWSDLPFIILTNRGGGPERNPTAARLSRSCGKCEFCRATFSCNELHKRCKVGHARSPPSIRCPGQNGALDEGERRLQTALAAGRLGAWELDLATNELTTSATFRSIFGRSPDEGFAYTDLLSSIHPADLERMQSAVRTTIETGADYSIEYRTVWNDGSTHWVEIRAQLYSDRTGRASKLVGVSADITSRLEEEEHQRLLNEVLEERVAARTRDLEKAYATVMEEVTKESALSNSYASPRKWRRSANLPAAWPMILTTS